MALDQQSNVLPLAISVQSRGAPQSGQLDGTEADRFFRIASLAGELKDEQIKADAIAASERIAEGRFYVACVGQFKRGKSTLLNALIGEPLLPSGVTPVTAVPTILRFGERPRARVRLRSSEWSDIGITDLEQYVSEAGNPQNRKGVEALEMFVPSPLLRDGMCFVDTPGIGSVFSDNTAATHAFIPHIDAVIVVIGADPPIAGDELALAENVAKQIPDLVFVLNKADRVTEQEREAAIAFTNQVLEDRLRRPVRAIFEVSALEQLDGIASQRDWAKLVAALEGLNRNSGRQIVKAAASRSLTRLSNQLRAVVDEERSAMTRPFEQSEERIQNLRDVVSQAEQSLNDLRFLLSGEQQRLSKTLNDRRSEFLKTVSARAHGELDSILSTQPRTRGPLYRRGAMRASQDVARRYTMPWLTSEQENAEQAYRQITKRFVELTNGFLGKAKNIGSTEMAYLPKELSFEQTFRTRSEFHFHEYVELVSPASPVRHVADLTLGILFAHRLIAADAHEFLDRLLETNSERVRTDLENRVTESRRRLESDIRATLRKLSAIAERALDRARVAHQSGTTAVESWLKRLAEIKDELAALNSTD
jgi:predicted GTPase